MSNKTIELLPRVVYQMCVHGALLVGSYAKYITGEDIEPNDYDLLVPHHAWQTIALLIPEDARPNKFGGWRFLVDAKDADGHACEAEVDVWPGLLEEYLSQCRTKHGGAVKAVDFINNRVFSAQQMPLRF
jgi:hypothetical protein